MNETRLKNKTSKEAENVCCEKPMILKNSWEDEQKGRVYFNYGCRDRNCQEENYFYKTASPERKTIDFTEWWEAKDKKRGQDIKNEKEELDIILTSEEFKKIWENSSIIATENTFLKNLLFDKYLKAKEGKNLEKEEEEDEWTH